LHLREFFGRVDQRIYREIRLNQIVHRPQPIQKTRARLLDDGNVYVAARVRVAARRRPKEDHALGIVRLERVDDFLYASTNTRVHQYPLYGRD